MQIRIALPLLCFYGAITADAQWTQFRGPNGSGVGPAASYPTQFSPTKNVAWKTTLPFGQSSPIVVGNRVYVTASDGDKLLTISLDAQSGKELWRKDVTRARTTKTYAANDPASPTPAADETGVFAFFPDFGLVAYTPDGKQRWTLPLGPFKNFYGMAGSPIIAGELLILVCDQQSGSYMLALDRKTGRQRWKTERTRATVGWSTPMIFRPTGEPAQIVIIGTNRIDSYSLATGEQNWWLPSASMGGLGTPVALGDTVLVSTMTTSEPWMPTFPAVLEKYDKDKDGRLSQAEFAADKEWIEHFGWLDANSDNFLIAQEWNAARDVGIGDFGAIAIKPGKTQGKLAPTSVRWRFTKNLPFIPAPLLYDNVYYMVRDGGIITSLDPITGKLHKEGRTREALGEYYASPIAADNKIFLASVEGKISVVKAGPQWEVLQVNDIGEEIHATPALSAGRIFVRTRGSLYCFQTAN